MLYRCSFLVFWLISLSLFFMYYQYHFTDAFYISGGEYSIVLICSLNNQFNHCLVVIPVFCGLFVLIRASYYLKCIWVAVVDYLIIKSRVVIPVLRDLSVVLSAFLISKCMWVSVANYFIMSRVVIPVLCGLSVVLKVFVIYKCMWVSVADYFIIKSRVWSRCCVAFLFYWGHS